MRKHEFLSELISFPVTRGQDLNAAAKLLFFEFHNNPQETKKGSLDSFVKTASNNRNQLELAARRVHAMLDNLADIFLPRDRLLGSAGSIPVYYWFIRDIEDERYPLVRDFLVRFEEDRRKNRQKAAEGMPVGVIDRQLVEYDRFNRSTNDLSSHKGRIDILNDRFAELSV